jgi:hypothetical protein
VGVALLAVAASAASVAHAEEGWITRQYRVTWRGCDKCSLEANFNAYITDGHDNQRSQGGFLELEAPRSNKWSVYFGLSGTVNEELRPGEHRVIHLAIYRAPDDTRSTSVVITARFRDEAYDRRIAAERAAEAKRKKDEEERARKLAEDRQRFEEQMAKKRAADEKLRADELARRRREADDRQRRDQDQFRVRREPDRRPGSKQQIDPGPIDARRPGGDEGPSAAEVRRREEEARRREDEARRAQEEARRRQEIDTRLDAARTHDERAQAALREGSGNAIAESAAAQVERIQAAGQARTAEERARVIQEGNAAVQSTIQAGAQGVVDVLQRQQAEEAAARAHREYEEERREANAARVIEKWRWMARKQAEQQADPAYRRDDETLESDTYSIHTLNEFTRTQKMVCQDVKDRLIARDAYLNSSGADNVRMLENQRGGVVGNWWQKEATALDRGNWEVAMCELDHWQKWKQGWIVRQADNAKAKAVRAERARIAHEEGARRAAEQAQRAAEERARREEAERVRKAELGAIADSLKGTAPTPATSEAPLRLRTVGDPGGTTGPALRPVGDPSAAAPVLRPIDGGDGAPATPRAKRARRRAEAN